MPTRCIRAVRSLAALLALLVGIQTLLPQLHCASEHRHAPSEAGQRAGDAGSGGAADDCAICRFLLATGALVLPDPAPAAGPAPAPLAVPRLVSWSARAQAPPSIAWSSPRGPPTA